jgi:two-component system sensor histidine kinase GlrK
MSLRLRLGLLVAGLLLGMSVVGGAALYWSERFFLERQMSATRDVMAEGLAQACRDALNVHDELPAIGAARALAATPALVEAYCTDEDGRIVAHADPAQRGRIDAAAPGTFAMSRDFALTHGGGRAVLVFSRAAAARAVHESLRGTARRIGVALGLALVLGLAGAALVARSVARPIHEVALGTREIARGRLQHRLSPRRRDEVGRLAEDFNRMAERLGELDRMKKDFVSNVTHELRSPLSAIEAYATLIGEEVQAGRKENASDYLTILRNNATRLGRFINDLLDLAKMEGGRDEVEVKELTARPSLEEVRGLFAAKARERRIDLTVDLEGDPSFRADPDKLQQILTNLVGNALKFTPPEGRVSLSAAAETGFVRLSVADTGPGVPEADRERIFDRFEQVKETRDGFKGPKGTGLGLAISKGLAELQGGRIAVAPRPGGGSVFSVWLPR